jgi:glycerol-3-phosphate acyltransferase PlsY
MAWAALIGYGIGSLPLGFLLTRAAAGVDIRRAGSGNVGAANVYRTAGRGLGVVVMLLDMAKGAGSVMTARLLWPHSPDSAALAGLAAIVGHIYPLWLRFRGGKGVAAACGTFAIIAPSATASAAVVFVLTAALTRYISLGSVLATVTVPLVEWLTPGHRPEELAAMAAAVIILFRHRDNLARLARGTERRFGEPSERVRA